MATGRPKYTIRLTRRNELLPACKLIIRTTNDLYRRVGRPQFNARLRRTWPMMEHWFGSDPEGMLVAVNSRNQVIGHAGSIVRDKEWYLCNLFVTHNRQSRGIGAELLDRSMEYGRQRGCKRFSLCTFAENPQAVALYTRFGMPAQRSILALKRKLDTSRPLPEIDIEEPLECRLVERETFVNRLNQLDRRARGIKRPEEHLFWLGDAGASTFAFFEDRKLVGYAVIAQRGLVGPIAVSAPDYLGRVLDQAVNLGVAGGQNQQILFIQGEQQQLINALMATGFRIDEVLLEMSTERLAKPEIYIPGSLAYY